MLDRICSWSAYVGSAAMAAFIAATASATPGDEAAAAQAHARSQPDERESCLAQPGAFVFAVEGLLVCVPAREAPPAGDDATR